MTCVCKTPQPKQQANLKFYCKVCSLRVIMTEAIMRKLLGSAEYSHLYPSEWD